MPVPEQVTAEVVEKAQDCCAGIRTACTGTPAEPPQNVIVLEQEPPAAAYAQSSPVEKIRQQMTYEQAQNVIVDCGTCKGWTPGTGGRPPCRQPALVCERLSGREQHSSRGGRHYMGQLAGKTGGITGKEAVLHDLIFRYVSVWHCRCGRTAGRLPSAAVCRRACT